MVNDQDFPKLTGRTRQRGDWTTSNTVIVSDEIAQLSGTKHKFCISSLRGLTIYLILNEEIQNLCFAPESCAISSETISKKQFLKSTINIIKI